MAGPYPQGSDSGYRQSSAPRGPVQRAAQVAHQPPVRGRVPGTGTRRGPRRPRLSIRQPDPASVEPPCHLDEHAAPAQPTAAGGRPGKNTERSARVLRRVAHTRPIARQESTQSDPNSVETRRHLTGNTDSAIIDSMVSDLTTVEARARVHAALGDATRLAIVDLLVVGDSSSGEIGALLGMPTNLVAHHLGVLESAGLIRRTRSEGDRRRSYVQLVAASLSGLVHPQLSRPPRVVFVCTHNSARSQLAAALLRPRSSVPIASAGTAPAQRVHPRAVRVARRHGVDLAKVRPVHVDDVLRSDDLLISVCDRAHEHITAARPGLHWSVPDPALVDTDGAFEKAYVDLAARVERLVPVLEGSGHG